MSNPTATPPTNSAERPLALSAEHSGLIISRIRWHLGDDRRRASDLQAQMDDFDARADKLCAHGQLLLDCGLVMREVEDSKIALAPHAARVLKVLVADAQEDLDYATREGHSEDRIANESRLHMLTNICEVVSEGRGAHTAVDLRDAWRRKILTGILSERIGRMADGLGWETTTCAAKSGPQDAADIVVQGSERQRHYTAELAALTTNQRLLEQILAGAEVVTLPDTFCLSVGIAHALSGLRESLRDDTPTEDLAKLLAAVQSAEKWLAELGESDADGQRAVVLAESADEAAHVHQVLGDVLTLNLTVAWRAEILIQVLAGAWSNIAEHVTLGNGPEEIAVDRFVRSGSEELLGAWLDAAGPSAWIVSALRTLHEAKPETLTWELPRELLIHGLKDIVLFLSSDAIGHAAADPAFDAVEELVEILRTAQAWLAELGPESPA